jgi:hypothetical protein
VVIVAEGAAEAVAAEIWRQVNALPVANYQ